MESKPTQPALSNRSTSTLLAVTILATIGNTLVTMMLWNFPSDFASSFACGMLIAQPCLLSIWCALVKQKLILRISFSMGILFGLYCLYMLTLANMDNMPLEVPLVCFGIIFFLTLLIQTPLYLIRRHTGYVLSIGTAEDTAQSDSQFGIKHLLIATTVAAVLVVIAQASFSQFELEGGAPWGEIIVFLISLIAMVTLTVWICLGFVFLDQIRVPIGILLAAVTVFGPVAVYAILARTFRGGTDIGVYFNTLGFLIALSTTIIVVLSIFSAIGYRLHSNGNNI